MKHAGKSNIRAGHAGKSMMWKLGLAAGLVAVPVAASAKDAWADAFAAANAVVEWESGRQGETCWMEATNPDVAIVVGLERGKNGRTYGYLADDSGLLPAEATMSFIIGTTTYAVDGKLNDQERLIAPLSKDFLAAFEQASSLYIGAAHEFSRTITLDGTHREALANLASCAAKL